MEQGIIVKGTGGFYDVLTDQGEVVTCRLRGRLRLEDERVLVGDRVLISCSEGKGLVEEVLPRSTALIRPPIANVEQVMVVTAAAQPDPIPLLFDRILVHVEKAGLQAFVVINKIDLAPDVAQELKKYYDSAGYNILLASAASRQGLNEIKDCLADRITTLAGPSGVGKSSLINALEPGFSLETGDVSEKLGRGRHTTRTVSLLPLPWGGLIADTPGFSRLEMIGIEIEELQHMFPEFEPFYGQCQFRGCLHRHEPNCRVKEAVEDGTIVRQRYEHYLLFLAEIEENKPY